MGGWVGLICGGEGVYGRLLRTICYDTWVGKDMLLDRRFMDMFIVMKFNECITHRFYLP